MPNDLRLENVSRASLDHDEDRAIALAQLIWNAGKHFYALIPIENRELVLPLLSLQLAQAGHELSDVSVLRSGESDIGVIASTGLQGLAIAQQRSLGSIMRYLRSDLRKKYVAALQGYMPTLQPTTGSGRYIARLAVSPEMQGRGYGKYMLQKFLEEYGYEPISLHVHDGNRVAIGLYESFGFERASGSGFAYPVFIRPATRHN